MKPQLVATDVDGTLLRSDETLSARSRAALDGLDRTGVPVVLVTGRPQRWLVPVLAMTGRRGMAVCANGAIIYDVREQRVKATYPLDVSCLREVADNIRRALPEAAFAVEYGDHYVHEPTYLPRWDINLPEVTVADLAAIVAEPAVKLLVRHPTLTADELYEMGSLAVGDLAVVTHGSGDARLEISAVGVTKATGLALLAAEFNVPAEDVVAFGDMPNDLPMMEWAGRSYAVANGHPDVLRAATEVVPSNDDDGVALTLSRWY
jgi:Cof subfamily protein (haloacid dehalogenase superfamily)